MKKSSLILLFLFPLKLWALELKVGDILLQPVDCWSCDLIEAQERSIYSHMGLVIQTRPQVMVIESLGSVRKISLADFSKLTEKGQNISVRRFQKSAIQEFIAKNEKILLTFFQENFEGLNYDQEFLWNNFDSEGNEKLYCSEMITKLLSRFLSIELPMKKMKYDINRDLWIKYFQGNPPDGKWGNSPADFEKSDLFYEVGEL